MSNKKKPHLTIAVSSRALFSIEDGHAVFVKQGQAAFDAYMRSKEDVPLKPGPAFPLVKKLLALNKLVPSERLVKVVVLSRNSTDAAMRIGNSIEHYGLDIEGAAFTNGGDRFVFAQAFEANLFLSLNPDDVRVALSKGLPAATLLPRESDSESSDLVRIAFDGDSVLFDDSSDMKYRQLGLAEWRVFESTQANVPLGTGPMKPLLEGLHHIQSLLESVMPGASNPLQIALVTARGLPAHQRPIRTLREWGLRVDRAIFAGGAPKGPLLAALGVDMFFDDMHSNCTSAADNAIAAGHVPFGEGGIAASH